MPLIDDLEDSLRSLYEPGSRDGTAFVGGCAEYTPETGRDEPEGG